MSETTTKARTRKTVTAFRGVRAILWNPENDFRINGMKVPEGCEMVRNYAFIYLNTEKTEQSKAIAVKTSGNSEGGYTPVCNLFSLTPGLNWVEAGEWDAALAASNARYDADVAEREEQGYSEPPVNEIEQLLDGRAIVVYEPSDKIKESKQFTGSLEDYTIKEIRKLAVEMKEPAAIQGFIDGINNFDMQQVLKERLKSVEQGY